MMKAPLLCRLLVASFPVLYVQAYNCPHTSNATKDWSDPNSWPNGESPKNGSTVTIESSIRLDKSPGVSFEGIVIKPTGQLTFVPKVPGGLVLLTKYIHIDGGRMDIGSEDCPYQGLLDITLLGNPDENYNISAFGEKFIGVERNGSLEIHGEKKLSWTELNGTLEKMPSVGRIFNDTVDRVDDLAGLIIYDWDPENERIIPGTHGNRSVFKFDVPQRKGGQEELNRRAQALQEYLENVEAGHVVAFSIRKTLIDRNFTYDYSALYEIIEVFAYGKITNKSQIRNLEFYDGYALLVVKGLPGKTVESQTAYRTNGKHQTSTSTLIHCTFKYEVMSYTTLSGFGKSYATFDITNIKYSVPKIRLAQRADSWVPGDKVVIASTDHDFEQMESGSIVACNDCDEFEHRIDLTVEYEHFGEIYKNVDMRAEVALISRNVVIEGDTLGGDNNGGHIMMVKGFRTARIENAELRNMGNNNLIGRYPIHWHWCGDVDDGKTLTYARSNSIHTSYSRCVTIHRTNGVEVWDNACVGSIGNGYFLEDGYETRNRFIGNLGMGQTNTRLLVPSDAHPSTFWISNPDNVMENNVAAGGMGCGIRYVFPDVVDSTRTVPIGTFKNNVAHSNKAVGFDFGDRVAPDGRPRKSDKYHPTSDVSISRLTTYKNKINVDVTGDSIEFDHGSFSDALVNLKLAGGRIKWQRVVNSVVLGDSANKGQPDQGLGLDRSLPDVPQSSDSHFGVLFGQNPLYLNNTYFDDFKPSQLYNSGAIGFLLDKKQYKWKSNRVRNALFGFNDPENGNRVFVDANATFRYHNRLDYFVDEDGSTTGKAGAVVLRPYDFQLTDKCSLRQNWNMAICEERYGQATISAPSKVTRADNLAVENTLKKNDRVNVVLGRDFVYIIKADSESMPTNFDVGAVGNYGTHNSFIVGLCVPKDAEYSLTLSFPKTVLTSVDDIASVQNSDGLTYFYDESIGVIYVKVVGQGSSQDCTDDGFCQKIRFAKKSGSTEINDCVAAALNTVQSVSTRRSYPPINKRTNLEQQLLELLERFSDNINDEKQVSRGIPDTLPKSSLPQGYGAGNTRPSLTG